MPEVPGVIRERMGGRTYLSSVQVEIGLAQGLIVSTIACSHAVVWRKRWSYSTFGSNRIAEDASGPVVSTVTIAARVYSFFSGEL
jgi:hypothetical protein